MYGSAVPQLQVGQLTYQYMSTGRHPQALDELSRALFATQSATQIDLETPATTSAYDYRRSALLTTWNRPQQKPRQARKRTGLSRVDLATRAGVAQSVISACESGQRQPFVRALPRLADAAGFELTLRGVTSAAWQQVPC